MQLWSLITFFLLLGTVAARDHYISDGDLQPLDEEYFRLPSNYRYRTGARGEQEQPVNGFYQGNALPRPSGFNTLTGFTFPPKLEDESPHPPINDSLSPESLPLTDLNMTGTAAEAPKLTLPKLALTSSELDDNPRRGNSSTPESKQPTYPRIPDPYRHGWPYGRRPGGRRATNRPDPSSSPRGETGSAPRIPGRGIVRGGPFVRKSPAFVNEPGVRGFMKSMRRLIRTYI